MDRNIVWFLKISSRAAHDGRDVSKCWLHHRLYREMAPGLEHEIPQGQAVDSFDFLPYLKGESDIGPRTQMVHNTKKDHYAFRDGDWLLVNGQSGYLREAPKTWNQKHGIPESEEIPVELYNLREDVGQKHNLAAKHPERVEAMQALLRQVRESSYPELNRRSVP